MDDVHIFRNDDSHLLRIDEEDACCNFINIDGCQIWIDDDDDCQDLADDGDCRNWTDVYDYNNFAENGDFHKKNDCLILTEDDDTIYQPLRSGRIWHKVNF